MKLKTVAQVSEDLTSTRGMGKQQEKTLPTAKPLLKVSRKVLSSSAAVIRATAPRLVPTESMPSSAPPSVPVSLEASVPASLSGLASLLSLLMLSSLIALPRSSRGSLLP